jgi:hypothetical protein
MNERMNGSIKKGKKETRKEESNEYATFVE